MNKPTKSPRRMSLAEVEALAKRDRNRILLLVVGALLLGGAYFATANVSDDADDTTAQKTPVPTGTEEPPLEQVRTMPFRDDEVLATIADATAEQRLTTSDEALTALLYYSLTLQLRNYEALGVRELGAPLAAAIADDPGAYRVQPFRVHGVVEQIGKRKRSEKLEEFFGSLRLEDGSYAHIAFVAPPDEDVARGDFLAMDGLFVQMYTTEAGGEMRDAPLLAGRTARHSVPTRAAPDADALRVQLIEGVDDDQLDDVSGVPQDLLWQLMAYASAHGPAVDWDDALELETEILNQIVRDGELFRGVPFRVPISGNLGCWTESAGENSMRLPRVTMGWIGNFTWKGAAPVIQFVAPFDRPDLDDRYGAARLVTAKGFFFKNVYYLQESGDPGRAPLFVMSDIEIFTPVEDPTPQYILWGVLGGTLFMIGLIFFLLRLDKRSSSKLQEELTRRRRARRVKADLAAGEASPETT